MSRAFASDTSVPVDRTMNDASFLVPEGYLESWAIFSADRKYRYALGRSWSRGHHLLVVGHNPSQADEKKDDQTIRILRNRLRAAGYAGFVIVNLFAAIATNPRELLGVLDPEGPENDTRWREQWEGKAGVVVGWGGKSPLEPEAEYQRVEFLKHARKRRLPVLCFGVTKYGAPRHPSRLSKAAKLDCFTVRP